MPYPTRPQQDAMNRAASEPGESGVKYGRELLDQLDAGILDLIAVTEHEAGRLENPAALELVDAILNELAAMHERIDETMQAEYEAVTQSEAVGDNERMAAQLKRLRHRVDRMRRLRRMGRRA